MDSYYYYTLIKKASFICKFMKNAIINLALLYKYIKSNEKINSKNSMLYESHFKF